MPVGQGFPMMSGCLHRGKQVDAYGDKNCISTPSGPQDAGRWGYPELIRIGSGRSALGGFVSVRAPDVPPADAGIATGGVLMVAGISRHGQARGVLHVKRLATIGEHDPIQGTTDAAQERWVH